MLVRRTAWCLGKSARLDNGSARGGTGTTKTVWEFGARDHLSFLTLPFPSTSACDTGKKERHRRRLMLERDVAPATSTSPEQPTVCNCARAKRPLHLRRGLNRKVSVVPPRCQKSLISPTLQLGPLPLVRDGATLSQKPHQQRRDLEMLLHMAEPQLLEVCISTAEASFLQRHRHADDSPLGEGTTLAQSLKCESRRGYHPAEAS